MSSPKFINALFLSTLLYLILALSPISLLITSTVSSLIANNIQNSKNSVDFVKTWNFYSFGFHHVIALSKITNILSQWYIPLIMNVLISLFRISTSVFRKSLVVCMSSHRKTNHPWKETFTELSIIITFPILQI